MMFMRRLLHLGSALLASALGAATIFLVWLGLHGMFTPAHGSIPTPRVLNTFFAAFFLASAHALVFGLPVGLLIQKLKVVGPATAAAGGFVIGALPLSLWSALSPAPEYSALGGMVMSADGMRTSEGWLEILREAALYGACGLVGGLCAWFVWRLLNTRRLENA